MNVIIDGPDGAGKTTLVNKLKKHYKVDSIRLSYKDPKDYNFYSTLLSKTDCIFDRQFISEMIYFRIFDRICQLDGNDFHKLLDICKKKKIKILILVADTNVLLERLIARGGEHQTILDNLEYLKYAFEAAGEQNDIDIIDTSKTSFKEIIRRIDIYNA